MNNSNEISNLLFNLFIFMIALLVILVIIYIILKLKTTRKNKDEKKPVESSEKKSTKAKTKAASTSMPAYNKQSIFDFMEFDTVEDNMIVQKNGKRYIMVTECQGVNYDLMSQIEKVSVEEGFQQFLNTLRHPIQIYIQTRTINLEKSISTYRKKVNEIESQYNRTMYEYNRMLQSGEYTKEQTDKEFYNLTKQRNLYEYARDLVDNTEKMSLNKNILNKKYYIIISYMPEEGSTDTYGKDELRNIAFSELYTKSQALIRTLSACSVVGKILNSRELVELLYAAYNRDDSEIFGVDKAIQAGYDDLYSTAPDVFEKKVEILDERIREESINLANTTIEKVKNKSQMQMIAEQKEETMEDLISQMAQILLEENKQYIGKDVSEQAIEEIQKEDKKRKEGGEVDEKKKATTRGRKKSIK